MEIVKDSNGIEYKKMSSGTCYHSRTDEKVINVLETLISNRKRIRLWYGENGKSWNEEHDIMGYIGRSTGSIKIPLLINNSRSLGGGSVLDHCIVKITDTKTKRVLYQHPNFKQGKFLAVEGSNVDGYNAQVLQNGLVYANCRTFEQAERLEKFMNGESNKK